MLLPHGIDEISCFFDPTIRLVESLGGYSNLPSFSLHLNPVIIELREEGGVLLAPLDESSHQYLRDSVKKGDILDGLELDGNLVDDLQLFVKVEIFHLAKFSKTDIQAQFWNNNRFWLGDPPFSVLKLAIELNIR